MDEQLSIGQKLKQSRVEVAKLSQEKAAQVVETTVKTWGTYERDQVKPPLDVLLKWASYTKLPISYFVRVEDDMPGLGSDALPIFKVPVVNRVPASGFLTSYDDELIVDHVYTIKEHKGAFALRVKGDSMAPRILEGDVVICAPGLEFINNRIYCVVTSESEHTLKKVKKLDHHYACIPINPAYETMILHESQVLRLIRVVAISSNADQDLD